MLKESLSKIDPEWAATGIIKETFKSLANLYNIKREDEIIYEAYKAFDKLNRGFITCSEFKNVINEVAPHLSTSHVEQIFKAADMYNVEKVSLIKDEDISLPCLLIGGL
jgi:Ca2+-binding EF-hand superfamily protein